MKIAIVGNGKLSADYGNCIDNCNAVIRFNHARIKGFEKTVGTKVDILALAGATDLSFKTEFSKVDPYILKEVGCIMFSGRKVNEDYEKLILKKKAALNQDKANIVFQYIDNTCFYDFCFKNCIEVDDSKIPSTGINVLCHLFYTFDYKNNNEFYIFGFDNFKSGHYFDSEKRNNQNFHDLEAEKQIIHELKKYKNIRFYN